MGLSDNGHGGILPLQMQYNYYQRPPVPEAKSFSWVKLALIVLPLIVVVFVSFTWLHHHKKTTPARTHSTAHSQSNSPDISLVATGDWIAHDSVNAAAKQADGSYDYLPMVNDFTSTFKRSDIRFCNDPILNGGESLGITGYPKFNSPTDFVTDMGKFGCNLVNTASNHSFDFTQANITNSVDAWSTVPNMLAVAGENRSQQEHDTVHYFTVKGVKFAFLAYAGYINTDAPVQNDYGVNVFSKDFAASQIAAAKQNGAKFIIVSMRWGTEYSTGVNAQQTDDAQFLADQGVNLILGHGSHELQPVAQLTGSSGIKTLVWYSLGNFLNTQEPPETLFNGLAGMTINAKTLEISQIKYSPIYMHYEWTAAQAAADNTNARNNLHLYPFAKATQALIDAQQLKTTPAAQQQRMQTTLNADGLNIPLVSLNQL
ncbi:MAG TPA: CapA family protein [Candidatus Microsaccharimonas sp.]|nr:CapA family protein [Candidatus Microsaccharimonas sp.]